MTQPDRRTALRHGLALSAALLTDPARLIGRLRLPDEALAEDRPWLAAARKAERWLSQSVQEHKAGLVWPADPLHPESVSPDLYTGMAGVVLFYLELHHATQDPAALRMARGGADYLLSSVMEAGGDAQLGLYTGLAGSGIVLQYVRQVTGDDRYAAGVDRVLARLASGAQRAGLGVEWNESTDMISGSAGIGLALLALGSTGRSPDSARLAALAGDRLVERSQLVGPDQRSWLVSPQMPRNYPNFSHGTAGVSYFLAQLSATSRAHPHLDAALAGERWLRSLATSTPNGGRLVYHSSPGAEQLYYLSWCHGPAGTARLYRKLAQVTADVRWDEQVNACAQATLDMKVPERSAGFWNNVSQCCGNCGVTEFFTALHGRTQNARYLQFAEDVAHDTLRRGTADGDGMKWVQAEHRVRPELLVAQTGLMQGAAGIGLAFLHLDAARTGRSRLVRLPDDPFA